MKSDLVSNPHIQKVKSSVLRRASGGGREDRKKLYHNKLWRMNQRKFQDPEIPLSPPPVLQIASCQSAKVKNEEKGGRRWG